MYDNIGGKIKGGAMIVAYIEGVLSLIGGISIIQMDDDTAMIGILVIIAGILFAYLSSWLLYGYGELIEKTSDICKVLNGGNNNSNTQAIKHDSKIAKSFGVQGVMNIPKRQGEDTTNGN